KGFTGCLRQLAGTIAGGQCAAGAGSGDIAPPSGPNIGVLTTCSAPALAGAQITYLHGTSAATVKESTERLLSVVGGNQVQVAGGPQRTQGDHKCGERRGGRSQRQRGRAPRGHLLGKHVFTVRRFGCSALWGRAPTRGWVAVAGGTPATAERVRGA